MMVRWCVVVLFFLLPPLCAAAQSAADTVAADPAGGDSARVLRADTTFTAENSAPGHITRFDDDKWKTVTGKTDFAENKPPERKPTRRTSLPPWAGGALRAGGWIIIIGLIGLLLYVLIRNISWDSKVAPAAPPDLTQTVENIEQTDIDSALQEALSSGNLRLAIRLYYLNILKALNAAGRIEWKKNKTNRDYLTELSSGKYLYDEMQVLTRVYELVWYGEHTPSAERFERLKQNFEAIHLQIKPA